MKFRDTKYGDLTKQDYAGDIDVSGLGLTSLEGAPIRVYGNFICSNNKLTSLKHAPILVELTFDCCGNLLTSLEGGPVEGIQENYACINNQLTTLKGAPEKVGGGFYCSSNKLTSLKYCPKIIEQDFICNKNKIESLKDGMPQYVGGRFIAKDNPNEFLQEEWLIRKNNPNLSEEEIVNELIKQGYIAKELKDIFIF